MALPIKKIYIDTKYKTRDSISNSNFKVELPMSVTFPENSVFYIDDVSIPHSWFVIDQGLTISFISTLVLKTPTQITTVLLIGL